MINKFDTMTDFINFYSEQAKSITPPNDKTKDVFDRIKCDLELSISKDEVLCFCENAIKQFQSELILFFNNNYKIDYNLKLDKLQWEEDLLYTLHYYLMYKELKEHQQLEAVKPPPPDRENIFCKKMPLDIPKEHFKILTEKNSKNGEPFLTQDQFNNFINRAFCGKTDLPLQKFNQAPKGEKLKIQYLFYQFYENYCFEYFNTGQTKDVFIKLLTENFIGWDYENVHDNFNTKPKKTL